MKINRFAEPYYVPSETEALRLYGSFITFGDREQKAWINLAHKLFEPSEIECQFLFPHPWSESHRIPDIQDGNLGIMIEAPRRGRLRLRMIGGGSYSDSDAKFEVAGYDLLPLEVALPEGARITAIVDLTNSRLIGAHARRLLKQDGTIDRIGEDPPEIAWSLGGADYRFTRRTDFEKVTAGQDEGYLMRARPCLIKSFSAAEPVTLASVLDQTEEDIEDVLRLFSFLSRERVDWFEISVVAEAASKRSVEGKRRIQIWTQHPADKREDPVLRMHDLLGGIFSNLLSALRSSPYVDVMMRTMAYSLSARHGGGDESDFLLAFAALETLVNALDEKTPLLPPGEICWNALSKKVRECIEQHSEERRLSDEKTILIKCKVAELKRPSVRDKMGFHLLRCGVKVDDLWLDPSTFTAQFADGLNGAIKERNDLVHATSVADFAKLVRDGVRIQLLFERLVLRLLGHNAEISSRALKSIL